MTSTAPPPCWPTRPRCGAASRCRTCTTSAVPDIEVEADQIRTRHVGHLLALSELRLVADDAAASFALAERALSLEPFDARGHRVALAAALRGRCPAQIAAAHRRVCSALRQLGVPPDPPTSILLRQAARWAVNARLAPPCERRVITSATTRGHT